MISQEKHSSELSSSSSGGEEVSLLGIATVFVDHLWLIVIGSMTVGGIALAVSFLITPTFTAKAKLLQPSQSQSAAATLAQSLGVGGGLGLAVGLKDPGDQFVSFLQSDSVQNNIVNRFHLKQRYDVEFLGDARTELSKNMSIASGKDGLISIAFDDRDPNFAADVVNAHIEELSTLLGRLALDEAKKRRIFFENELARNEEALAKAERALLGESVSARLLRISPSGASGSLASLQASISAQEVKVASLRGIFSESAPEFKQALTELSALRSQLVKAESIDSKLPQKDELYISRFREFKYLESLQDFFSRQYEAARVDESKQGIIIQVVDFATAPERKSKPRKAQIALLASLMGFFSLVAFVYARHAWRNAHNDPVTAERMLQLQGALRRALFRSSH